MRRLILLLFLLAGVSLLAQQPDGVEGIRMEPRANVVSYNDENAIEKLRYDNSPFLLPLDADWQRTEVAEGVVYSQEYFFPKECRDFRIFFRMQAPSGYGLWLGDRLMGVVHESGAPDEFDITDQVKFGKTVVMALRPGREDDGTMLDAPGWTASQTQGVRCALLLKPLMNVQDYTLSTHYSPTQHSGTYTIDADLHNHRKKGRCYFEVEVWDPHGQQVDKLGKWVYFDKRTDLSQTITSTLQKVQPWSAESPMLYTAVLRLYNEDMVVEDMVGTRFGFRTLSLQENLFMNGRPFIFRGITMTPPTTDTPEEVQRLRETLVRMKLHNINAIRTCGGAPAGERFYELCSELGFYVVVDANLFPRSTMGEAVATDVEYSDLFVERVRGMYGRLKNHTCIVAWSLGESPDNGVCMVNAYNALKMVDRQRPVLYTGAQYADNTDMIVPQSVNLEMLRHYMGKKQSRALLMLSYGSSEGNTFGGMQPLWKMVYDQPKMQGGFYRCSDWQQISESPIAEELKALYSPVHVQLNSTSVDQAEFEITNLNDFVSLSEYKLEYVIYTNLKPMIVEGDVSVSVAPGERRVIKLKVPAMTLYADEDLMIRFVLRQRGNTPSVPKNTIMSTCQFVLPSTRMECYPLREYNPQPLVLQVDSMGMATMTNDKVAVTFDQRKGVLTGLSFQGHQMVKGAVKNSFMRMPTPNDRVDPNGVRQWRRYGQGDMQCEVLASSCRKVNENDVGIDVMLRYYTDEQADLFDVRQSYLVLHTGDVIVSNDIVVSEQLKSIAKVGVQIPVSEALDTIEWYGRSVESYPDRNSSGVVAHQHVPVNDFAYPYQPAQESGNRTETRWLSLRNGTVGLYVDLVDTVCNFSLGKLPDSNGSLTVLNVDYQITGIGGAVGGMNLDESVLLKRHKYHFAVHMRPYDCSEHDGRDFRQVDYPKAVSGVMELPVITKSRDRFDAPMTVKISSPDPKAELHYTLDGTIPTEESPRYTHPFTINSSTVVKARAFKKGESPSFVATEQFAFDYVASCTFAHKPNTPYNKNASTTLIDGEFGDVNDLSRGWLGFSGHPVLVNLELGKIIPVGTVVIRFAHVPDAWVFAPAGVKVSVSQDGENYSTPVEAQIEYDAASDSMNTTQLQVISVPMQNIEARYVRIEATPIRRIPAWHRAKGLNPWIMLDEVQIQEEIRK